MGQILNNYHSLLSKFINIVILMLINKLTRISSSLLDGGYLVLLYIIAGLAMGWISSMFYNVVNDGYTVTSDSKFSEDLKEMVKIFITIIILQLLAGSFYYHIKKTPSLFFPGYIYNKYGNVIILYTLIWSTYHPQFMKNTIALIQKYFWQPKNETFGILLSLLLTGLILISTTI